MRPRPGVGTRTRTRRKHAANAALFPGLQDKIVHTCPPARRRFVLRISGTACEYTTYGGSKPELESIGEAAKLTPPAAWKLLGSSNIDGGTAQGFVVPQSRWDSVLNFSRDTGAELVLGLNQLQRHWPAAGAKGCDAEHGGSCTWDNSNMRTWMAHNKARGANIYGYECVHSLPARPR